MIDPRDDITRMLLYQREAQRAQLEEFNRGFGDQDVSRPLSGAQEDWQNEEERRKQYHRRLIESMGQGNV